MTTLQEAAKQALEALEHIQRCIGFATATIHQGSATWCQSEDAIASIKAALAQQGEQQPVAWYEYNQDLDAWFLAYGHNPKAKTRPLVFGDTAAPACQVDRLQMLVEQGKEAQELAKIMKDFADKNPKSLMLKELDK